MKVHIRWMIRRDMNEVRAIEFNSFEYPWLHDDFVKVLQQRNVIGMVAEEAASATKCKSGRIAGFFVYELHETRLHILDIAVAPEFRRRGVGRQIIEKLLGKLSSQRRVRITVEIRETNTAAHLFFQAMGFKAVTVLKSYYDDVDEDAYLFMFKYPSCVEAVQ